jgi:hypothetical protein
VHDYDDVFVFFGVCVKEMCVYCCFFIFYPAAQSALLALLSDPKENCDVNWYRKLLLRFRG